MTNKQPPKNPEEKRGRKHKFPTPGDVKEKIPAVLCTAERVLSLYNDANPPKSGGEPAQKIAQKVRDWMKDEAKQAGWGGVHFLPEVMSQHGAGCILSRGSTLQLSGDADE